MSICNDFKANERGAAKARPGAALFLDGLLLLIAPEGRLAFRAWALRGRQESYRTHERLKPKSTGADEKDLKP